MPRLSQTIMLACLIFVLVGGWSFRTSSLAYATDAIPPERTLVAAQAETSPVMDGVEDDAWAVATPILVRLNADGSVAQGGTPMLAVTMRAIVHGDRLYLLARWSDPTPPPDDSSVDTIENKLTMLWSLATSSDAAGRENESCLTLCHIAYVQPQTRLAKMQVVAIPQINSREIEAAGLWRDGTWVMEWSRPLVSSVPRDMQFGDPARTYRFGVAVTLNPDQVIHSGDHHNYQLAFERPLVP